MMMIMMMMMFEGCWVHTGSTHRCVAPLLRGPVTPDITCVGGFEMPGELWSVE